MSKSNFSPLIVLGLNEINFEFIQRYVEEGELPNFKSLLNNFRLQKTTSENSYELLEPWIQWVTVQTGKSYKEHQVFRLGDIVSEPKLNQIFELIEQRGYNVGAVSPFNADNRLDNAAFFVPDPWTKTKITGSRLLSDLSNAVSQAVNDNASQGLKLKSSIALAKGLIKYPSLLDYSKYTSLLSKAKKPGSKAVILDRLLIDMFMKEFSRSKPDLGWIFLNSGAHIQHHYLYNSKAYSGALRNPEWYCPENFDPLIQVLRLYDEALGRLIQLNRSIIVLTGLHQIPHGENTFYWRVKEIEQFLQAIGISYYREILPRMSRDFLLRFDTKEEAATAQEVLISYFMERDNVKIFTVDNRGTSLFVELTYPNDIQLGDSINSDISLQLRNFKSFLAFVAIKNGKHDGIGYFFTNYENNLPDQFPLIRVFNHILEKFPEKVRGK